jgi:hypothetical protein
MAIALQVENHRSHFDEQAAPGGGGHQVEAQGGEGTPAS